MIATEVKIKDRRNEIQKRLDQMRMQRELERHRIEQKVMFAFIKDEIVRGLVFAGVSKHIREQEKRLKLEQEEREALEDEERKKQFKESQSKVKSSKYGATLELEKGKTSVGLGAL